MLMYQNKALASLLEERKRDLADLTVELEAKD